MRGLAILALLASGLIGCAPLVRAPSGVKAPPTQGVDALGYMQSLEAHRGKVVLLSFWHSHCPPCRALFKHEKALLARYAGRPFAILGVNTDASPDDFRRCQEKEGLSWPSCWDGSEGTICSSWKVDRFPSLFLIDPQGVVYWQHAGIPPEGELEAKIGELLKKGGM